MKLFGRKGWVTLICAGLVFSLGMWGKPSVAVAAIGAIGTMVTAFCASNAYIDGKHAK